MKVDKEIFRRRALQLIAENGRGVAGRLSDELGISRTAASKRLLSLIEEGVVEATGTTRSRVLRLRRLAAETRDYASAGLAEDRVWREVFKGVVTDLPENVREIWAYGASEMVNNAIDHSGSPSIHVGVSRDALMTQGWVRDEGEGIFLKIQRVLGLYDAREAILELAKGKLTTDPEHHSGEGIFFSSRVFDTFMIRSGALTFMHDHESQGSQDWLIERSAAAPGTDVSMRLANDSGRTTRSVFDEFSGTDAFSFSRTVVPVRLAQYEGEKLISRSQAKRLSMRFERFRDVVLDFSGVVEIGQAFADELFRVFALAHPQVELMPINTTLAVERMIQRARTANL
jgi:DNA-binding Lrp family transcriptional regulator